MTRGIEQAESIGAEERIPLGRSPLREPARRVQRARRVHAEVLHRLRRERAHVPAQHANMAPGMRRANMARGTRPSPRETTAACTNVLPAPLILLHVDLPIAVHLVVDVLRDLRARSIGAAKCYSLRWAGGREGCERRKRADGGWLLLALGEDFRLRVISGVAQSQH